MKHLPGSMKRPAISEECCSGVGDKGTFSPEVHGNECGNKKADERDHRKVVSKINI